MNVRVYFNNCNIMANHPVVQYLKAKKTIKSFDKRKKKLIKEVRREQKKMTKIGQKIDDRKRKIAALEMEIRMIKLELDGCKDEKKEETPTSTRMMDGACQAMSLEQNGSQCVSFNPAGGIHTIVEENESGIAL